MDSKAASAGTTLLGGIGGTGVAVSELRSGFSEGNSAFSISGLVKPRIKVRVDDFSSPTVVRPLKTVEESVRSTWDIGSSVGKTLDSAESHKWEDRFRRFKERDSTDYNFPRNQEPTIPVDSGKWLYSQCNTLYYSTYISFSNDKELSDSWYAVEEWCFDK